MKIQSMGSAIVLALSVAFAAPVFACSATVDDGKLSSQPAQNVGLSCGEYEFANYNSPFQSSFVDSWKFTVAEDVSASIGVFDLEYAVTLPSFLRHGPISVTIFDTKNMTIGLYDDTGALLSQGYQNETLSNLALSAGHWYTLKVSGQIGGILGSVYTGVLTTSVAEVPLGSAAPMLGSALGLIALRLRKRTATATAV